MAKALGVETLGVKESRILSTATVRRVEEKVEELGLLFEERKKAMFALKEEVIHLLDVLDLNATSVEEMFIVNQEQYESLQPQDMESARQTLRNLRQKVEAKKQEVSHSSLQSGSVLNYILSILPGYLRCYFQDTPALKKEWQYTVSSRKKLENTHPSGCKLPPEGVFSNTPFLSAVYSKLS